MSRRGRIIVRVVCLVMGAGVVLSLIGYFVVLPWWIHRQIIAALDSVGIPGVEFEVRRSTAWNLEIADFRTSGARPDRIAAISSHYSPWSLIHGRIGSVMLRGVEIEASIVKGRFDAGALKGMGSGDDPPVQTAAPALNIPLDRIDIADSFVTLDMGANKLRVAASGSMVRQGDGRFKIELTLGVNGEPVGIAGTVGPGSRDADLTVVGNQVEAGTLGEIASAMSRKAGVSGSGEVAVMAHVHIAEDAADGDVMMTPRSATVTVESKEPTVVKGIGGTIEAEAKLAAGGPMTGKVKIREGAFDSPMATAEGITGEVDFKDLAKLIAAEGQKVTVTRLTVGRFELTDGSMALGMNGAGEISISRTQWGWLGGTIGASNVRVNPPRVEAVVDMADIDAARLLDFFAQGKATGEGKLDGKVPVVIDGPSVELGKGELVADAGGTLRVKALADLSAVLDQAGQSDQSMTSDQKKKIVEALADFRYDVLDVSVYREPKGSVASVHLIGRGQHGFRQALDVTLNFRGMDEIMGIYLGFQRFMNSLGAANQGH